MRHTRVLSAAAGLLFVATAAQAQRGRGDDRRDHQDHQDQREHAAAPVQQRRDDDDRGRVVESQSRQRDRDAQFERARQAQQEEQIEQARRRAEATRVYDRDRDRDDRPAYDYRYNMGGVYRQTNQYGVDALRRAVDVGYQQGYRAGQMDRRNGESADFRRALDFQNDNDGFAGNYVPQSDYSYYFREGFQRGYDDAYWTRSRYGTFYNGNASILGDVVAGILGLTLLR